jgi:hypothetical protein
MRRFGFWVLGCLLLFANGCGSVDPLRVNPSGSCGSSNPTQVLLVQIANCSGTPVATLPSYDRLAAQFLDEETRHPVNNLAGNVVWGTRYYLESLLTAYEATGNPKYIQSFLDSGQWVLNLAGTMTIVDVPDSGQPMAPGSGSQITVTGWPTWLGSFSVSTPVPTQAGQVALYVQSLGAAANFEATQQDNGTLQLAWTAGGQVLETNTIQDISDLNTLASMPLVWGQSVGRIKATGVGLPAPGVYPVNRLEKTIWNSEQAGGILLPFAHFLMLAKQYPGLINEATQKEWTSEILAIAHGYESIFISDGQGGLRQHNPLWLPNTVADVDAPMDYISAEATFRLFLYELTEDPHQLAIANGLILHQLNLHWSIGAHGWFLLQLWPDLVPWSSRTSAPAGSPWDSFKFDPSTPSPVTDGGFFVDLLHYAKVFKVGQLCLTDSIYNANRAAFQQYLLYSSGVSMNGAEPLLRGYYPTGNSNASDPITPSQDPFSGAGFLAPEVADQSSIDANWSWMQRFAQNPQGQSIGYYLRAWARSEAAELNRCKYAGKPTSP